MFNPYEDKKLPNGATIIDRLQRRDGCWCWVADFGEQHVHRFVTWLSNPSTPGSTYWGHYTDSLDDAIFDWIQRSDG
jgi:hypothetical protein